MNKLFLPALILTVGVGVAGCGGRDAQPVALTNYTDGRLDCPSIKREFDANERQIVKLIEERNKDTTKNIIAGTVGATIFFPALFFMDLGNEEKVEINALRNRNSVLEDLAATKGCPKPRSRLDNVYQNLDNPPKSSKKNRHDEV